MNRLVILPAIAGNFLLATFGQSLAEPLDSMDKVGDALQSCWTPPVDIEDSSVTLSFSFKRDGTLIGPPRPTAIDVKGDEETRKAFVDAATKAVEDCMPLEFAPKLAEGIAGAVYTMEFSSGD